ncbi:MAG: uroporphyrinogen decarboxylase [Dehalococcoidales bacterium]|nr:uroporphyrinogen decarboxylase [Dehalococcoidales bacterium]
MNDRFLRACRREPVDCTPIWLMRQAGRYLPEYRQVRQRYPMLDIVKTPELAVEVTMQPLRRFDLDAAIIFADILPPLESLGVEVSFGQGDGPVVSPPIRDRTGVAALRAPEAAAIAPYTVEAIRLARRELAGRVPLIGFAGAPFTLAGYLVEGGSSRDYSLTKRLMYAQPEVWGSLMDHLSRLVGLYLQEQIRAGAQAVQVFDSWVGVLSPADYREFVLPYVKRVMATARGAGVPTIYFSTGTGGMPEVIRDVGADVIGLDWRVDLGLIWERLGVNMAVQGNLDPLSLLAPLPHLRQRAGEVLARAAGRRGHIFNLGHGVLPDTPVEHVDYLVRFVHEETGRGPVQPPRPDLR